MNEKLFNAIKLIKEYCDERECVDCCLNGNICWAEGLGTPDEWKIKEMEEK